MKSNIEESVLIFLNTVTPRVGPENAWGLLKDAHMSAFAELFKDLGVPAERIDAAICEHLKKAAQGVLSMPVPSPIQRMP